MLAHLASFRLRSKAPLIGTAEAEGIYASAAAKLMGEVRGTIVSHLPDPSSADIALTSDIPATDGLLFRRLRGYSEPLLDSVECWVDSIFKNYAELKQRWRVLSARLRARAASDKSAFPLRHRKSSAGFELFEARLLMSTTSPGIAAPGVGATLLTDSYPGAQTTVENVSLTFSTQNNNALAASGTSNDVGLSVSSGILTLSTTSGLTFIDGTANGSGTLEFSGSATAMNAAMNGLVFKPATNFTGSDPLTFITAVNVLGHPTVFTTNSIPMTVTPAPPTVATAAAANPNPVTGTSAALSVLGADDAGESNLTYTWATTGTPPAAVAFSSNGNNAAKDTTATFSKAGTYNFVVTITDGAGLSVTSSVSVAVDQTLTTIAVAPATPSLHEDEAQQFSATAYDQFGHAMSSQPTFGWSVSSGIGSISSGGLYTSPYGAGSASVSASSGSVSGSTTITVYNAAPTVATAAAASPSPVTGATTALSVLGADDGGESNLTYTWATTGTPPAAVAFGANDTNAAKNTAATFAKAGTYNFVVTIADAGGLTATSSVTVTVNQTLTSILVSPAVAALNENQTQQFTAVGYDQFGQVMTSEPSFTWSKSSGVGTIDADGLYTAPYGTGSASITAASGAVNASASITVTNAAPTIAKAPAASPNPATGTTTTLSVLGADDGGEPNLTYTWAILGTPPAAVNFSVNGTNAAKNTTATFTAPGTYDFQVTVTDAGGLSATSSVSVTVNQTLTTIAVSPATSPLNENQTQQFSAVGYDQFGNAMTTQPTFAWSIASGVGSVDSTGLYTAPYGTGSASVTATSGSVVGSASITVTNATPTVATAAAASPATVTSTSTALSVLGADDGGESNLIYSWSVLSRPTGAAVPSFSLNGSNAAQNTTATFSQAGTYVIQATITDAGGLSTTSPVTLTVDQTFTSIALSPANTSLAAGGTQQFSATALDQFGIGMAVQPSFTWSATDGVIDPTGLFVAPPTSGPVTIGATSGSVGGSTTVTIVGSNTAIASPSTVTGNSTTLSVSGGATSGVTYTWTTLTEPFGAASPTFSVNASSAAQTTTATFYAAGNYTFQVAIDSGATTTQTVDVTVNQTLTTIDVAPGTSDLNENGKQAFSAIGFDQFNKAMLSQPSLSWSVSSGGGTIDGSGFYTAAGSGGAGPATISATSGSIVGSANVAVSNATPTVATAAAASPLSVFGTSTLLSVVGSDDGGESNLTYTWSTIGTPPATIAFSANDSNAAKDTTASFTKAGDYQFLVTIADAEGLSVTSNVNVTVNQTLTTLALSPASPTVIEGASQQFSATATDQFGNPMATPSLLWSIPSGTGSIDGTGLYTAASTSGTTTVSATSGGVSATATITVPNEPPTVAVAAAASPDVVTGTSTALSVLGADDGGQSNLTYTWSTYGTSPAAVTFSANANNAAKNTIAHFTQAGDYQFDVTITDAEGLSVTSTVNVTVNHTLTSLSLTPASPTVVEGASQQFSASATDQFGNSMQTPSLNWSVQSGSGSIDSTGLFTAASTSGTTTVLVSHGGVSATATITVPNEPPTVAVAAASAHSPVTSTSTALSVLGADDGGESNLTYTWSTYGTSPAAVTFSTNAGNAARNTIAHFTQAGDYQFQVTITDAQGLLVTSSVNVTVNQTLRSLVVSPSPATVVEGSSEQLSAAATDQFGNSMTAPALTWSVRDGGGTIGNAGLYTAGTAPGSVTVAASSGSVSGTATITVPNEPPTVAIAAAASANPVTTTSTNLSVLGADDGGEPNLTYTWSAIGTPPAPISLSANGTNAAKDATATFSAAGTYDLMVTITDAEGATVTSSVNVIVESVLASVKVTPAQPAVGRAQTVQFIAAACDQFGAPLATQPALSWSTIGNVGSIDASGLYTAPVSGNGTATVVATAANVSGIDSLNLVNGLSASVPQSVSTAPGIPAVFAGSDTVSITDADSNTASVPVSITVSATHGTISLSGISGLNFLNGTQNNGALVTFIGNIADVDKALRGMAYVPDAGFSGAGSLTVTINEVGTGNPSPSYSVAIDVAGPAISLSSGGSGTFTGGNSSLTNVLDTSSIDQTTVSPSTYSGSVLVDTTSFGDVVIDGGSSTPTNSVTRTTPTPTPTPAKPSDTTPTATPQAANGAAASVAAPTTPTAVPDMRVESMPEQVFPFLAAKSEMSQEMDAADDKLVHDRKLKMVAGSATVASFGASAAYVLWLLRGGSLLSSLLSILPAWQSIDPLPVLDNFESRKRRKSRMDSDSDDESLESMVDKANSEADRADVDHESSAKPDAAKQDAQKSS